MNRRGRSSDGELMQSFAASIAHELRTPLTSILGYLDLLQESLADLAPTQTRHLEAIARNAHRLSDLLDDLPSVAPVRAAGLRLRRIALDPIELARTALDTAWPAAVARQIDLRLRAGGGRPLLGDQIRLGQALDNLIANAVKFTRRGGQVTVSVYEADGHCTIAVTDTGIGIPEVERPRAFERLFRSSNAREHAIPGSGLGLTIASAIAQAHGGSLELQSGEGEGTTARLSIPLAGAPIEDAERRPAARA